MFCLCCQLYLIKVLLIILISNSNKSRKLSYVSNECVDGMGLCGIANDVIALASRPVWLVGCLGFMAYQSLEVIEWQIHFYTVMTDYKESINK